MRPVLKWLAGAVVVGLCGSAGAVALAGGVIGDDTAGRYRLAAVTTGDVAQTVTTDGTVDFVDRADVSFGTGGTLATLTVRQGQQVAAGQRLGTLDTAALRAAVDSAESDLAGAKATLESDQERQAESVDSEDDQAADGQADQPVDRPSGDSSGDSGQPALLAKRQQAVRAAQTAASRAIAAAKAALAAQGEACARKPPAADGGAADAAGPEQPDTACADALAAAMAAQQAVSGAQDTLQKKIGELAATLSAAAADTSTSDSADPSRSAGTSGQNTPDTGSDTPQDKGGGADTTPTAATIAADQAAVDAAEADRLSARRDLARATLTSPIAGTVASVGAAAGDAVSAGSTVVVIIGPGAAVVETTVPVERIDEIEVGQVATVTPSGAATGVAGKVSRIGRLADDSADSVAYPVTITVDDPPAGMPAGSTAGVAVVVDTARDVLTVPTSAVHRGTPSTVTVLSGGEPTEKEVTVGAVGPLWTEVTGGVERGEQVVLADLDEPLPSADDGATGGLGGRGPRVMPGGGPQFGGPQMRVGRK